MSFYELQQPPPRNSTHDAPVLVMLCLHPDIHSTNRQVHGRSNHTFVGVPASTRKAAYGGGGLPTLAYWGHPLSVNTAFQLNMQVLCHCRST